MVDKVRFAFTEVNLELGAMNLFLAFDVCFYGSELAFEISSKIV